MFFGSRKVPIATMPKYRGNCETMLEINTISMYEYNNVSNLSFIVELMSSFIKQVYLSIQPTQSPAADRKAQIN